MYIHSANYIIFNRCALAGVFTVFNVGAALPHHFFAVIFAVPNSPAQRRPALAAQQHPRQRVAVLILIFGFLYIAFGLSAQNNQSLCFIPDFSAYDWRMVILDIEAFDLAVIDALLFAEMVLAVGLLQLGIALVFFVFEDIQHSAGVPLASCHCPNPCGVQFPGNNKASLAADIVGENTLDHFCLNRVDHQFAVLVFVIAQEPCGIEGQFTLFKFSPVPPLEVFTGALAFFLGKRREDGKHQLAVPRKGRNIVFFKNDFYPQFL